MTPRHALAGLAAAGLLTAAGCGYTYDPPPAAAAATTVATTTTTADAVVTAPPQTTTTAGGGVTLGDGPLYVSTIVRIVDGDTIEVANDRKVRLIGVDTPEVYGGKECWGPEASAALKAILPVGTPVALIPDKSAADRYGRSLFYVETAGVGDVGARLVAEGHATSYRYAPDTARSDLYDSLQAGAQTAKAGMWSPAADECRKKATS